MFNKLVCCFVLLGATLVGNAQSRMPQDNLSNNFGSSPNAAHSGYGESLGVDPFTGKLQAGFTLYNYQNESSGLSHSITLDYQGGGITVDQMASDCGLGWSIGTGGVVTRNIQGLPDEHDEWGFNAPGISTPMSFDSVVFTAITNDTYDGEYDLYNYSAGGTGGQFVIGKSGNIVTIPSSNVKIERIMDGYHPSAAPIDSCMSVLFKVTLENGIQYYYSNFDCSRLEYNNDSPFKTYASSTWYLSKIISAFNKDTIYFDYTPVVQEYTAGYAFVRYAVTGAAPQDDYTSSSAYKSRLRDMRLTSVRYPDGTTVTFEYDAFKRLDFKTDNALKSIKVTNQFTASTYSYKFGYTYLNRGISGVSDLELPYQSYSSNTIDTCREEKSSLKLDRFYRTSGTDSLPGYSFEYLMPNLPARGSYTNVDHWGYYSQDATGRIPAIDYQGNTYSGASREPKLEGAMRNSLVKVNLPTGGYVGFEYELNNVSTGTPTISTDSVFEKDVLYSQIAFDGYVEGDTFNSTFPKMFPPSALPGYRMYHRVTVTPGSWPSGFNQTTDRFDFKSWKRNVYKNAYPWYAPPTFTANKYFYYPQFAAATPYTSQWQALKTDTFTYRITPSSFSGISGPSFSVVWEFYKAKFTGMVTDTVYNYKDYGGLRVKKIIRSDMTGQDNDQVTEYRYCKPNGESSGFVINEPKYDFAYGETYDPLGTDPDRPVHANPQLAYPCYNLVSHHVNSQAQANHHYNYLVRTSAAQNSIKYVHGSPAAYQRVEQYLGTAGNYRNKTVYSFTDNNTVSVPAALKTSAFPFPTWPDVDFGAGLPYRIESYNEAGVLEKKVDNEYQVYSQSLNSADFMSIKVGIKEHPALNAADFAWKYYYPVTAKIFPVKSTQVEYFTNGDSLVSTTETEYDTARMVPRLTKTNNARDEQMITKYYYPFDFNIAGAMTTLNTKGIIYSPVRTEVWKGTTQVMNAAVSTFTDTLSMVKQSASYGLTVQDPVPAGTWGSFNNTVLLPNPASFTRLANLDKYDSKGNLVQTSAKGVTSATVWNYKSSLPTAQVTNAMASRIAYTSFEADGKGGWTYDAANVISFSIPFTGKKVFNLSATNTVSKNLVSTATYILSLRTRAGAPVITMLGVDGVPVSLTPVALDLHNSWRHYQVELSQATQVTISAASAIKLDELRLYPEGAAMTTYTYDPIFGVTSTSDLTGRTVYYEYDKFGRLKYQRDMDGNIRKVNEYKNQEPQN